MHVQTHLDTMSFETLGSSRYIDRNPRITTRVIVHWSTSSPDPTVSLERATRLTIIAIVAVANTL